MIICRKLSDGRDLYTVAKASTLKSERGRGIYRKLANAVVEKIREESPGAAIYRQTKSDKVKAFLRGEEWEEFEIDDQENEVIKLLYQRRGEEKTRDHIRDRYSIFVNDPLK